MTSSTVRSFTLNTTDGAPLLPFEAGQFLAIRVLTDGATPQVRTYTVSPAPCDAGNRIFVKRKLGGLVSNHLQETLEVSDVVAAKTPKGAFTLDAHEPRPTVRNAGGVDVTPMISMTRQVLNETVRWRVTRQLSIVHAAQTTDQRAFAEECRAAERQTDGKIRYISVIGSLGKQEVLGQNFDVNGRINTDFLRQHLALDDYDFFLCGPAAFMQTAYDALHELSAPVARLFAEAFAPAALTRKVAEMTTEPEVDTATITFQASGFEQPWEEDGPTLLETAEALGLAPTFSCRSGSCGTCAAKVLNGDVAYRAAVTAAQAADEVLICCTGPAESTDDSILDL